MATVIDCASKMVVGWSVADHMRTTLVTSALDMARGRIDVKDGCIFHSDYAEPCTMPRIIEMACAGRVA